MKLRSLISILFPYMILFFFFFNDTATTEIYTLSLHDALPILLATLKDASGKVVGTATGMADNVPGGKTDRSEEHTSELQSLTNLVCRLLLEIRRAHV